MREGCSNEAHDDMGDFNHMGSLGQGVRDELGISVPVRGAAWVLRMRFTLMRKGGMLQDHSPGDHTLIHYYRYVNLEREWVYGSFGADLM